MESKTDVTICNRCGRGLPQGSIVCRDCADELHEKPQYASNAIAAATEPLHKEIEKLRKELAEYAKREPKLLDLQNDFQLVNATLAQELASAREALAAKPMSTMVKAIAGLNGCAVANIAEPSDGDVGRLLRENGRLRTLCAELREGLESWLARPSLSKLPIGKAEIRALLEKAGEM